MTLVEQSFHPISTFNFSSFIFFMTLEKNPHADPEKLQSLHEKVNAMLDIPVPKEGDEFPFPVEASISGDTPARDAAQAAAN